VLHGVVQPANIADRDGARAVLAGAHARHPGIERVWADTGYSGALSARAKETLGIALTNTKRPPRWVWTASDQEPEPMPDGFTVAPRRWVVERTFGWLGRSRRLSRDYEALPTTEEAWIHLAMIRLMVARLAKS
jgi:transposase